MRLGFIPDKTRQHVDPEDIHEIIAAEPQTATVTLFAETLPDAQGRHGWFRCMIAGDDQTVAVTKAATPIAAFRSALRGWKDVTA